MDESANGQRPEAHECRGIMQGMTRKPSWNEMQLFEACCRLAKAELKAARRWGSHAVKKDDPFVAKLTERAKEGG